MNTNDEKTETVEVKLTTEELFDMGRAAERAGFASLPAFISYTLKEKAGASRAAVHAEA